MNWERSEREREREREMSEVDPDTLLEWLALGSGDDRDIQLLALEQLCMLLLMSDNVDKCFEAYVTFIDDQYINSYSSHNYNYVTL